ncbi:MAG: YidC/Oxa1 family membrane protein insertase [Lachnospiraceae bacterium]|nr:YidC/Oxa1 family membrane protein insertase [Lachnospiraceae bacterium]
MQGILLTANDFPVFKYVVWVLGKLIEIIFNLLDSLGLPNVGLSIVLFTLVIYVVLTPMTYQQQKFSKLSAKMNPELKKIQDKYKGRRDEMSMQAMQAETQAVYKKYGVSPVGSCLQMGVQLPILLALYQVIYRMPAYVGKIRDAFYPLVSELRTQAGSQEFLQTFASARYFTKQFTNEAFTSGNVQYIENTYIDVLNRASTAEWESIVEKFPSLAGDVASATSKLRLYNSFFGGLLISDSPWYTIRNAFASLKGGITGGALILLLMAVLIPVLAAVTQWLNFKLMPQPTSSTGDATQDAMAAQMKSMNTFMPLVSAFFCLQLPAGMGIYWVAAAVIRSIQQVIINKQIDKIDFDSMLKQNEEKLKQSGKLEKSKKAAEAASMASIAAMSTKGNYRSKASITASMSDSEWEAFMKEKDEAYRNAKPGSITQKANLVRKYNGEI